MIDTGVFKERTMEFQRIIIQKALEKTKGKVAAAARKLGIKRTTLTVKIRRLGIEKNVSG